MTGQTMGQAGAAGTRGTAPLPRGDLISMIFHELRAPLAVIGGYAKLLEERAGTPEGREYARIIRREVADLTGMADNLLLLDRLDGGPVEEPKELVDVTEQIRRVLNAFEPRWREKALELDLGLEEVTVRAHGWMLLHIWRNLIDNAVKYSPRGGLLRLRLGRAGERVRFTVQNQGDPIPPEELPHIFERFYCAANGGDARGHGVGMAVVQGIVRLCGGRVSAESGPELGTRFTVEL